MLPIKPEAIITGKNAIITSAICQPRINAIIMPLQPKLTLVKIFVTLLMIP